MQNLRPYSVSTEPICILILTTCPVTHEHVKMASQLEEGWQISATRVRFLTSSHECEVALALSCAFVSSFSHRK